MIRNWFIFILLIIFMVSCSHKNKKYIYFDTGEIQKEIYFNQKGDTIKIINYSKKGDTLKITRFFNNNVVMNDIKTHITDNGIKIIRKIEYFKDNNLYGINCNYFDDSIMLSQQDFYIKGKLIGFCSFEKRKNTLEKIYYKRLNDSTAYIEGGIVYDKDYHILSDSCFGYIVNGKKQIDYGQDYKFEIDLLTDRFGIDSVFTGIELGDMDTNYTFSNIYFSMGGFNKRKYNVVIKKPKPGYHFIQGYTDISGIKDGYRVYDKIIHIYYDFIVKP